MALDHSGRLIDHVHLRVADLDRSRRFYRAVLTAIGLEAAIRESDQYFSADELWIDTADGRGSRAFNARPDSPQCSSCEHSRSRRPFEPSATRISRQ